MEAIRLYDQNGRSIDCRPGVWPALLTVAKNHGWRPRGALTPPMRLDLDDPASAYPPRNDYLTPGGQMVSRQEAEEVANALDAATFDPLPAPFLHTLTRVAGLCHSGPILICEASGEIPSDEADVSEQLASLSQAVGHRSKTSSSSIIVPLRRPS